MGRRLRLPLLLVLAALALVAGGCGDKEDAYHEANTEGPYLRAGDLTYQIQLSRGLNPSLPFDKEILRGLPAGDKLAGDEVWFGVWLRVQNETDRSQPTAPNFKIVDTLEKEYEPEEIDAAENPLIYRPVELRAGGLDPNPDSLQGQGGPRGQVLVFKLKTSAYQNRPLEFEIEPVTGKGARVELDL